MWVWASIPPGTTIIPWASQTLAPGLRMFLERDETLPFSIPTSDSNVSVAVTTFAFLTTRSTFSAALDSESAPGEEGSLVSLRLIEDSFLVEGGRFAFLQEDSPIDKDRVYVAPHSRVSHVRDYIGVGDKVGLLQINQD